MADLDHKQVHEEWSKIFLVNNYEDWSLEIDPEIKEDFATIALFLDYKTAKSSGEEKEVYEGIKKASLLILDFLEVQIIDTLKKRRFK